MKTVKYGGSLRTEMTYAKKTKDRECYILCPYYSISYLSDLSISSLQQ